MINAIKGSTEIKRNEKCGVSGVRGRKYVIKSGKKTCFSRVTRPISVLKLIEVW